MHWWGLRLLQLSLPCSELCECIDCENVSSKSLAEDDNDISHNDIDSEAELNDTYDDDAEIYDFNDMIL